MPPERRAGTTSTEWMRRAKSNLARAKGGQISPEVLLEDLCFDAQQAAEKAIKAILAHRGAAFPKTHDLIDLLTLLQGNGLEIPKEIRQADQLTGYAVETRYPGLAEEVTMEEYHDAIRLAERVVRWSQSLLQA